MKIFKSIILSVIFVSQTGLFLLAQENVKIKKKDFNIEIKEVGFKDAWKEVKEGEKLFSAGLGTYPDALKHYLRAYKYNNDCAKLNYKIGVCYLATSKFYNATDFLEKAYLKDENVTDDIYFMLARAYHLNLDFDQAIDNYKAYYSSFSVNELDELEVDIDKYIKECKYGKELINNPERVIINNLGGRVNSEYDDYNPVLHPSQDILYFTSRRETGKRDKRHDVDNKFYENVFFSEQAGELWKAPKLLENKLESKNNESVLLFSKDGNKIYLYNGKKRGGEILVSELKKDKWKSPKTLKGKISSKNKETTLALSPDENEMIFVSNQEGTIGGMDLFYSKLDEKGKWSEPVNLGAAINTPYDEEGVYWHSNEEDRVYFSSQGHNSMGGFDVFVMERDENKMWSEPQNLGYPINTPNDDIFFKMEENNKQAYYSSVRQNGYGGKDLYKIIFLGEEKDLKLTADDIYLAWDYKPIDDLFYVAPQELKVDTALFMVGMITDSKLGIPIQAKIEVIDTEFSRVIATGLSDTSGIYKVKISKKKDYGVEVTAKGYLFYLTIVNLSEKQVVDSKVQANFQLDRIDVGAKMVLKNIFFETNKATLKAESTAELERVATLLRENPGIRLEISGHTDNVGSYRANQRLSEARAKSVVDYLVNQGVDSGRLEYKGYSFTEPVADNNTVEGRAQNRRVEFKVLSK